MLNSDNDPERDRFLELFAEHEGALHAFLRALLPSREEATEAFQETAITLWRKFNEFDPSRDFKAWAFGIARNKALAAIRYRQRERLVFSDELIGLLADDAMAIDSTVLTQEQALDDCLRKLPDAQRELVLTAYEKGTRIDRLGQRLGQTPMALYKKLHRIRQSLLLCVEQAFAKEKLS